MIPDYSPQESMVYRAVRQGLDENSLVMTNVHALAVLFSEIGRPADAVNKADAAFMESVFSRAMNGIPILLVIEEQKKVPVEKRGLLAETAVKYPAIRVDKISEQGLFWAVRLSHTP